MKPIPVLNGSEYRERATMKRHVKENKAGMNSGTWNTAQGEKKHHFKQFQRQKMDSREGHQRIG